MPPTQGGDFAATLSAENEEVRAMPTFQGAGLAANLGAAKGELRTMPPFQGEGQGVSYVIEPPRAPRHNQRKD